MPKDRLCAVVVDIGPEIIELIQQQKGDRKGCCQEKQFNSYVQGQCRSGNEEHESRIGKQGKDKDEIVQIEWKFPRMSIYRSHDDQGQYRGSGYP